MFQRQLNFGMLLVQQLFYVYYKGKSQLFFNLQFLLLLRERGMNPESCQAICEGQLLINRLLIKKTKCKVLHLVTSIHYQQCILELFGTLYAFALFLKLNKVLKSTIEKCKIFYVTQNFLYHLLTKKILIKGNNVFLKPIIHTLFFFPTILTNCKIWYT